MNSQRVNVYLIVNVVRNTQYVLIEYVVRSTLVCDFEHSHRVWLTGCVLIEMFGSRCHTGPNPSDHTANLVLLILYN